MRAEFNSYDALSFDCMMSGCNEVGGGEGDGEKIPLQVISPHSAL